MLVQRTGQQFVFSASDLNNFLECDELIGLEMRAAKGEITRPPQSESAAFIASKGDLHERAFADRLRQEYGAAFVECSDRTDGTLAGLRDAEAQTIVAMEAGAEVIYQAAFFDERFFGRADFLRKTSVACERWPWSYTVVDAKLAHNAKPYFLVQLCNYSEHVGRIQGTPPAEASILPGSGVEQRFALGEYEAYYRRLKAAFLEHVERLGSSYPHEVPHCQICRWYVACERRRDADDYLGIVATMRRDAIDRFRGAGIATIAMLANADDSQRPARMTAESFERLRGQARLQHAQRTTGVASYELLTFQPDRGFALLPEPDAGDVFFDMEGDPLYSAERGLEYLFGIFLPNEDRYRAFWATSPAGEQHAFEQLVDALLERYRLHPQFHVYHYAPYEVSALKRLAGRYCSREDELASLLRGQVFVDLYAIVRQGVRISQPSYSIKRLETFYGFTRETKTQRGDDSILMFESWLSTHEDGILQDIERYNRDDCISTLRLRDWLVQRKAELEQRVGAIPWRGAPEPREQAPDESDAERARVRSALLDGLTAPENLSDFRARSEAERARWLLGHMLDYHRHEENPAWWAYFHRCDNRDELIESDREALGGLRRRSDIEPYRLSTRGNAVHVYEFPLQQHALSVGDSPYVLDAQHPRTAGTIVDIDEESTLLHLKVSGKVDPATVTALAPQPVIQTTTLRESLLRVARLHLERRLDAENRALCDVLLGRDARFDRNAPSLGEQALSLDESYLFVQGPPGSGKSTRGAAMIVDLIAAGKRVAIMANAHKAIHNLLHKVEAEAHRRGLSFHGIQRYNDESHAFESALERPLVVPEPKSEALDRPHDLAAGTAWVFSREALAGRYDHLVIEEAGQVSLANAIACAPCARNVVLLGDPLQLAQVSQGAHPPGIELSVLEHLLGDEPTVPASRGVFLDESYRMHPEICGFISQSVYAARLRAASGTAAHRVDSPGISGSGLRFVPVEHEGNARESLEEAGTIVREIALLLRGTYSVVAQRSEPISEEHVLVVSPYNAQRRLLRARLCAAGLSRVRVGTVDSFQGLQAPIVFYSMATSSGDELPRGIGFLYEKNRLNVAISRAQCISVLVCSPRLLDVLCSTPEQMSLVNLLCAFVERAEQIPKLRPAADHSRTATAANLC